MITGLILQLIVYLEELTAEMTSIIQAIQKLPKQKQNDADKQYVNFVDKMMFISKKFKEEFGEKYSPRDLDNIMLYYYDEYLKKYN